MLSNNSFVFMILLLLPYLCDGHEGDECSTNLNICGSSRKICVNTAGSYRCDCRPGYTLSNNYCIDIDECTATPNICGPSSAGQCVNTEGSYRCECSDGYTQNNQKCTARDVGILAVIEGCREEIIELKRMVARLIRGCHLETEKLSLPRDLVLPLRTNDDLDDIERRLLNKDFEKSLVYHLGDIGGSTTEEVTGRILRRLISTQLAKQLSWKGEGQKRPFEHLQLKAAVTKTVQNSPGTEKASCAAVEKVVEDWFKDVGDMEGGRKTPEIATQSNG